MRNLCCYDKKGGEVESCPAFGSLSRGLWVFVLCARCGLGERFVSWSPPQSPGSSAELGQLDVSLNRRLSQKHTKRITQRSPRPQRTPRKAYGTFSPKKTLNHLHPYPCLSSTTSTNTPTQQLTLALSSWNEPENNKKSPPEAQKP